MNEKRETQVLVEESGSSQWRQNRSIGRIHSMRFALAGLVIALAISATANAQVVTTGTAVLGNTSGQYAVVLDSSTATGYYVRVWLGHDRVMQIWPTEWRGQTLMLNYHIYRTMGQHWTLCGGADRTKFWQAESAGELALDSRAVPPNATTIFSGYVAGRGRKTYWRNVRWYPVQDCGWDVQFFPTN